MKTARQETILEIIASKDVETQSQLIDELAARGVKSTQATLSRDIKELRLVKELTGAGGYRYAAAGRDELSDFDVRLKKIFRESVTSHATAQNILVIRTLPGLASAACAALDGMRSGSIGTVLLAVSGAGLGGFLALSIKPYIAQRFATWGHVWEDVNGKGFQQTRALSAAASGGLFGVGAGNGWLHKIFAAETDMYYIKKDEAKVTPFLNFALSAKGQKMVDEVGYVAAK